MLRFNSFRAQRYLRSRFVEGKFLLASEGTDLELELLDFTRKLVQSTLGDIAIDVAWETSVYKIETEVTSKAVNVLTVGTSVLDLVNIGDKVFKNGLFETEITSVGLGTITVTDATNISVSNIIEIQTSTTLLLKPGEAWFDGLPFIMRDGSDQLVSGSTLAAGILLIPGGGAPNISVQDEPIGKGKLITFNDGGTTPTAEYSIVISAREQVITNIDDPFIKNVNIPESTSQKLRLTYRLNVVPAASITHTPVPYTDSTIDGNLVNYIDVTPQAAANGSEISRSVITSSTGIDGRNLEITIRNNSGSANPSYPGSPVGNTIPSGASDQAEYANGKFIDSLGQEYWLNAIFNDVVANQVILRLDKEVGQTDPQIVIGKPYKLVKRDIYVTDDNNGSPLGQLFWEVARASFSATEGFAHSSKVADLRNKIESLKNHEEKTTVKFNLRLLAGGVVSAEPGIKASGTIQVIDNTFDGGEQVIVNGVSFTEGVVWTAGGDTDGTAASIGAAISNSTNPSIENQVTVQVIASTITVTAVASGTVGNSITLSVVDPGGANFTLSGATLSGGVDGTVGELTWDADFKIVNPHNVTQLILAGNAVIREGGAVAYFMDLDNGGVVSKGSLAVTTTSSGTTIVLSGSPDLSQVKIGNTLLVGQTSTTIVAVDDNNKELGVFPSIGVTGSGFVYLDTFGAGTLVTDPNTFILAVKTGDIIQVTGRGELEPGESTTSGVPIQLLQYIGSPSETDSTPDYSNAYAITQSDDLTKAIGKLNRTHQDADTFSGRLGPTDQQPDYSSEVVVADGQSLVEAISALDSAASDIGDYTGAGVNNTSPAYASNNFITDGDDLTTAVSDLDLELGEVSGIVLQDRNLKLIKGGTWSWNEPNNRLTWSAAAFVQIADLTDVTNEIAPSFCTLGSDGVVAYVNINRVGPGGLISVSVGNIASLTLGDDDIIIARRVGNDVLVGHTFLLKTGERLELDGALAEINRRLNQLKLTAHETATNKARIAAADITQLDSSILTQELSNFVLSFSGAVLNFTTGAILAQDDVTALGIDFTPFSIPVSHYFWYSVGLVPSTVTADNRITAQVFVVSATASNAVQASAPYANLIGDKKLGAIQIFNNAGTLEIVAVRSLGVGSGSGSGGTGDTTEVLETVKNVISDSIYDLAAITVFKVDEDALVDPSSTGVYSLVDKSYVVDTAETMISLDLLDQVEFKDLVKSLPQVDILAFWKEGLIDDAATYEVSRTGGTAWQTASMERVGESTGTFTGTHTFTDEADNAYITNAPGAGLQPLTNTSALARSQSFVVAGSDLIQLQNIKLTFAKTGAPTGVIFVKVVKDDGAGDPSLAAADLVVAVSGVDITTISIGVNTFVMSAVLGPGTYHIVIETDALYKSTFVLATTEVRLGTGAGPGHQAFDGAVWNNAAAALTSVVNAIALDLRLRITSSQNSALDGFAVLYDVEAGEAPNFSDTLALLEANHLGSTDQSIDRSVSGRGIFLRRPDGTLRELVINDLDQIEIWSV